MIDHSQQLIPGFDLTWLLDCANILTDVKGEVDHLRMLADQDALDGLRSRLDVVHQAILEAGREAVALAKQHKIKGTLVGDTERDGTKR